MTWLGNVGRLAGFGFSLAGAYVHFQFAFRRSRRAFKKALTSAGLPDEAVRQLLDQLDAMKAGILSLLKR